MRVIFSPGTYYIGDPCYVADDKDWIPLLEKTDYFSFDVFEYKNRMCYAHSTKYGDGYYYDNLENDDKAEAVVGYGVDSGTIGIIPMDILDENNNDLFLGKIVEFEKPFEVYCYNGVFHFGELEIDTSCAEESVENNSEDDEDEPELEDREEEEE